MIAADSRSSSGITSRNDPVHNFTKKPTLYLVPTPTSLPQKSLCLCRKIFWKQGDCIYFAFTPLGKDEADKITRFSESVSVNVVTGQNWLTSANDKLIGVQQIFEKVVFGDTPDGLEQSSESINHFERKQAEPIPFDFNVIDKSVSDSTKSNVASSLPFEEIEPTTIPPTGRKIPLLSKPTTNVLEEPPPLKQHNSLSHTTEPPLPLNAPLSRTNTPGIASNWRPHCKMKFVWKHRWALDTDKNQSKDKTKEHDLMYSVRDDKHIFCPENERMHFNTMPSLSLRKLNCKSLKRLGCSTSCLLYTSLLEMESTQQKDILVRTNSKPNVNSVERSRNNLTKLKQHPDLKHIPTNEKVSYLKQLLKTQKSYFGI